MGNGLGLGMLREATTTIPQEMRKQTAPKQVAPAVNQKKETNRPTAFFREAPAWTKPAVETDYPTVNSARKYAKEIIDKQFDGMYKDIVGTVQDSEYQYLVKGKEARNIFLKRLGDEYAKAKEQSTYGFLSEEEDNIFRDAVMQELMRVMYLNHNYENEVKNLNKLINNEENQ